MRNWCQALENRKVCLDKLREYGFIDQQNRYQYECSLMENQFKLRVCYERKEMTSRVFDMESDEEYPLVDVVSANGDFVGQLREEVDMKMNDLIGCCTTSEIFKSKQAKQVIAYVKNRYGDELEHLWPSSPKNAIWRHKENKKWYGVVMCIDKKKLGIGEEGYIEILDVKADPQQIKSLVDHCYYYEGYHMNKMHWLTVKLDGSLQDDRIYQLIDESYMMKGERK